MKQLLNWFKSRTAVRIINQVRIAERDPCRLRLTEWRSSPDLTGQARRCLSDVHFRTMLDVLDREHPAGIVLPDNASIEMRAVWQARCEGYTMAIANIESMAIYNKPEEALEATFEPPESDNQ